jgi:hypothetical protein
VDASRCVVVGVKDNAQNGSIHAIACLQQSSWNSAEIRGKVLSVKAINWRDEKLYKITSRDYGDPFSRAFGVILYSATKGVVIALGIVLVFLEPHLFAQYAEIKAKLGGWQPLAG